MVIFDANMILRYLLDDNKEMADRAEAYLEKGHVFVTLEVVAEVIYVLNGVYALERSKIASIVKGFLAYVDCRDMKVLTTAMEIYESHMLDFVDCVLYGYHVENGWDIATFDRKLLKLLDRV